MFPNLTLLVLYIRDLQRSRDIYTCLGLDFTQEQHGTGPVHYATELPGGAVLDLYPAGSRPTTRTRLGLRISDMTAVLAALVSGGTAVSEPRDLPYGAVRTVADPDGNVVELVTAMFCEHEVVVRVTDLPQDGLVPGDVGTVVGGSWALSSFSAVTVGLRPHCPVRVR